MKTTKTAFIYIRVTNTSELDYRQQLEAIQQYVSRNHIQIINEYVDHKSSSKGVERDGLKQLLKDVIDTPIDCILVYDHTRVTRNDSEYRTIRDILLALNVPIVAVKEHVEIWTPMEKFLAKMQETLGELDNKHRSEIVKRRMKQQAEAGYSMQRPPLGYEKSFIPGLYTKNVTADALSYYFQQTLNGEFSVDELKKAISRLYSNDKSIGLEKLRKLVSNPYYIGLVSYSGHLYKGLHEPLLTVEKQDKLKGLLS